MFNAIGKLKNSLSDVLVKRVCTINAYRRWHHAWISSISPFPSPFCVSRIVLAASTASPTFLIIVARSQAQKHGVAFENCHWMTSRPDFSTVLSIRLSGRSKSAHSGRSIHRTFASSPLRGLETACNDEIAEQVELILAIPLIGNYSSPNVRDVTLERRIVSKKLTLYPQGEECY